MSGKLAYERYQWFHRRIKSGKSPNAGSLARRFEISVKQAQRDISFMRDRLLAPLSYNAAGKGYEYDETGYELPPIWFHEDELLSFCLALRLASTLPDRSMKTSLNALLEKFIDYCFPGSPAGLKEIREKVSVKNIQYYRIDETVFHRVLASLFRRDPIVIKYFSPHSGKETKRTILPLHLFCYMGSWHLIAYCRMRNDLRDFVLSRISDIRAAALRADPPANLPDIKNYLRKNFGLMSGKTTSEVALRFSPSVSPWVSEQVWHRAQGVETEPDGGIILRFPVADLREVRREVLRFGSDVEVLSPKALRDDIKKEIKKMSKIYR